MKTIAMVLLGALSCGGEPAAVTQVESELVYPSGCNVGNTVAMGMPNADNQTWVWQTTDRSNPQSIAWYHGGVLVPSNDGSPQLTQDAFTAHAVGNGAFLYYWFRTDLSPAHQGWSCQGEVAKRVLSSGSQCNALQSPACFPGCQEQLYVVNRDVNLQRECYDVQQNLADVDYNAFTWGLSSATSTKRYVTGTFYWHTDRSWMGQSAAHTAGSVYTGPTTDVFVGVQ